MSHKTLLMLAFLMIVGGGAAAVFYAQQQTADMPVEQTTAPVEQTTDSAKVVGQNVTFTITEGSSKRWEINAQKAFYYPGNHGARLEGVNGTLFNDAGEPSATFSAPTGEFNQDLKSLLLTGGVTVTGAGDSKFGLTAPQMTWSPQGKEVVAEGGVQLQNGDLGTSTAQRCRFAMDFSFIALEGNAQSQMDL
jgi:LPS export ABC transporter protein LptC